MIGSDHEDDAHQKGKVDRLTGPNDKRVVEKVRL